MKEQHSIDNYSRSLLYSQEIEKAIANQLGLPELKSGGVTIRNEKGWRENEKVIDYVWIVQVSRSFVGFGGVFAIKFKQNEFRDYSNKEELIHGIFDLSEKGLDHFYTESMTGTFDEKTNLFRLNLLAANEGITLDGVSYQIRIIAWNIDSFIRVSNPKTDDWKKWEAEIWEMGKQLAKKSGYQELITLFE
ncbi:hypothetical protein [Fluviicola sp.]|uniref:hypothetical protein n=1 Tax=Fluviicola sp. TaxID=1917219 RepID=UPI0031E03EA2